MITGLPDVVVCAAVQDLDKAGQFAKQCLANAELRTFDDIVRRIPIQPLLIYLNPTRPEEENVPILLEALKQSEINVVIYCTNRTLPEQAMRLGRLVGKVRPLHTEVVFGARAAVSALLAPNHGREVSATEDNRLLMIRERLGLTQTEIGRSLGVSLRTVQNWERRSDGGRGHLLRDLQELISILDGVLKEADVKVWLRSHSESFSGKQPIDLILDGKARDVINEFRRLQEGEPI